jgi:alpha-L-rhamnosidase
MRQSPLYPIDPRCQYLRTPLGVDPAETPMFSWRFAVPEKPSAIAHQSAYRILAATSPASLVPEEADLWDSGKITSSQNLEIPYEGKKLPARTRVYWAVQVWDAEGRQSALCEPTWFETALSDEDWAPARWIAPDYSNWPRPLPAVYLRRAFRFPGKARQARAYVCGLGYNELYLNNQKVGDRVLEPAQTDYETYALYSVHDITASIRDGENAIGVILGNGWFNQDRVWTDGLDPVYGLPGVIAKIVIESETGEEITIVTDESWNAAEGPVRENNVYAGETYDARLEAKGWAGPRFGDSGWKTVQIREPCSPKLSPQTMPPIRRTETRRPVSRKEILPGVWVFDTGQNMAGWARIRLRGAPAQKITLRFSEALFPDGTIDPTTTGTIHTGVVQTDHYICRGGGDLEEWEPRFTYHGFQYVEVTGLRGEPEDDFLEAVAVHTDLPEAGAFECSDQLINRAHQAALWTLRSNLHGLPTDCPARERCGWTGDAHVVAEYTLLNFDSVPFWRKYLRDIENGLGRGEETYLGEPSDPRAPPNIVPGRRRCQQARPDWGVACVLIPWRLYQHSEDKTTLARHYPMMQAWTEYLTEIANDHIVEQGYGDWCPPGGNTELECPVPLSSTAYFFATLQAMAEIAGAIGKRDQRADYLDQADRVHQAFIEKFYDPKEKSYGSQTANALALSLGLFPEGHAEGLAASLADEVTVRHQGHFAVGIHGMNHLFRELTNHGLDTIAWQAFQAEGFPGFKHHFSLGATTLWETFYQPRVHPCDERSRSHPMQGGYDAWFFTGIAGIQAYPEASGFSKIVLRPSLIRHLEWANAWHETVRGRVTSSWIRRDSTLEWNIELPGNTRTRACLPAECHQLVQVNGRPEKPLPLEDTQSGLPELELSPGKHRLVIELPMA